MAGSVLRRLIGRILLVVLAASLSYPLAASALDPRADLEGRSPRPPAAVIDARLDELNARGPLLARYLTWASGVPRGDLGRTLDGVPASAEMGRRIGVSVRLMLAGALLGTVLGVAGAVAGAVGRYGIVDHLTTVGAFTVLAVPVLVLAVLLQLAAQWVNDRAGVRLFAWTGEHLPGDVRGGPHGVGERLRHLLLPTLTIALGRAAIVGRCLRATLRDAEGSAFLRTALAKGLSRRRALTRHALRVAIVPVVPVSAYGCATLLAGAACTEKVFAWHGMGEWLIDSIHRGDVNAVAAYCCFAAVVVLLTGLLSDLAVAALDPRART